VYNINFSTPISSGYGILPNSGTLYWGKDAWTWTYKSSNYLRNCNTTLTADLPSGGVLNWQWRKLVEATFQNNPTHTAITTTTIDGGNITTGSITAASAVLGDAAVGTLKIAGDAVTVTLAEEMTSSVTLTGIYQTLYALNTTIPAVTGLVPAENVSYLFRLYFHATGSFQWGNIGSSTKVLINIQSAANYSFNVDLVSHVSDLVIGATLGPNLTPTQSGTFPFIGSTAVFIDVASNAQRFFRVQALNNSNGTGIFVSGSTVVTGLKR
jgi:hypothetical protein